MIKEHLGAASSSVVRLHNRRVLLQLLRHRPYSRAELAAGSGLSVAAIMNVLAELDADGLVQERAPEKHDDATPRIGRPGAIVSLESRRCAVLGLHIAAGSIQAGAASLDGRVRASRERAFRAPAPASEILGVALEMLREVIEAEKLDQARILGLGVAVPGLVDPLQRVTLNAPRLGWTDVDVAGYFEQHLDYPTLVDNNVRAMAVAESRYGSGVGLESLAFVHVRGGVGGGLILNGAPYRGGTHGAVEVGHLRVRPTGPACGCGGTGCLETLVTDQVVAGLMVESGLIERLPDGFDHGWTGILRGAVESGDERALAIRDQLCADISSALLALVNLLNPQMIVLGGLLNDLFPVLIEPLRDILARELMPVLSDPLLVRAASFGTGAGLAGAATVALDQYVFGPQLVETADAPASAIPSHRSDTERKSMNSKHRMAAAAAAVAIALGTTACAAQPQAEPGDDSPVHLDVGFVGTSINGVGIVAIANELGLWEKYGVEVNPVPFTNGPTQIQAMQAGDIDIANIGAGAVWLPASGQATVIAVAEDSYGDVVLARPDAGIETLADLQGKRIGVPEGGSGEMILELALREAGLTNDDIERVVLEPPNIVSAFVSGQIDAAAIFSPLSTQILDAKPDTLTLAGNRDFPGTPFLGAWVAPNDAVKANDEGIVRFLQVYAEANDYMIEHTEEAVALAAAEADVPEPVFTTMASLMEWTPSTEMLAQNESGETLERFATLADLFVELGRLEAAPDAADFVDTKLLATALAR